MLPNLSKSNDLNTFNIAHEEIKPIFIVGMPRSGTTLIEQILSSHPKVFGCDEVEYIPFLGFAKSTKQEFGYVISDDESNETNCICSAEYFVNDLDKIIKTANSIDINTLYEKLTDLPSGLH